jgi:hypothetical protein
MIQGGRNSPGGIALGQDAAVPKVLPELAFMFDDSLLGTSGPTETEHLKLIERILANCVAVRS